MGGLMLWFLVGQAVAGLPAMSPGTEVQVVPPELYPPLAKAVVKDDQLVFKHSLTPNSQVKLIFSSAEQKLAVLSGRVSPDGSDILIQMEADKEPVSFKAWLVKERHIKLVIPVAPAPQQTLPKGQQALPQGGNGNVSGGGKVSGGSGGSSAR